MSQKIFISYSWTTPEHEEWVLSLAKRLMSDGIEVVLDKWDLKEGHDLYDFMESMVKSPEINKVLIVLDKKYTERADSRKGGVGTETQIISPKIYKDVSQEKFIPIVRERNDEGVAYVPTYLDGRVYIDLSSDEHFEENYESLIRNIYGRPSFSKPKLGKAPSYLFEETPLNFNTTYILRGFENQIVKNPERVDTLMRDFLNEFTENLKGFSVTFNSRDQIEIGKLICENLNQYTPLRDDFIKFFDILTKSKLEYDIDILIKFMEELPLFLSPLDNRSSWSNFEFDNFKIIIHELLIYLVAVSLKNENYEFVEEVLYSSYFTKDKYNHNNEAKRFDVFYDHTDIIKPYYNQTHSQNFFSATADFVVKRIPDFISKRILVQADLLCYHISELNDLRWFPMTYIYDTSGRHELFYRLESKRHFEKVKVLFDVETIDELEEKLNKLEEKDKDKSYRVAYSGSFDSVTPLYRLIDKEKLGTKR
ncbi:MAG: toll/interleukin-1 receptor domain-containing protein [Cyclobacteriaceae bacterium]